MNDPGLNNLFKWSIEHSDVTLKDPNAPKGTSTDFDPKVMQQVFGGYTAPSEAQMMVSNMETIMQPRSTPTQKKNAFEHFEELIANIDNANNMETLKFDKNSPVTLWNMLIQQLEHEETEVRMFAAWCVGTAVENNPRAQQRLLVLGAIPTLVKLATEDSSKDVRKKAIGALSRGSRNFQPTLDAVVDNIPSQYKPKGKLDAGDMESVDSIMDTLRANAE